MGASIFGVTSAWGDAYSFNYQARWLDVVLGTVRLNIKLDHKSGLDGACIYAKSNKNNII